MLSGLIYQLSPRRRRFMRQLGRPALAPLEARLAGAGSPAAISFCSTMLHANAEYLTYAISSPDGALFQFADHAAPRRCQRPREDTGDAAARSVAQGAALRGVDALQLAGRGVGRRAA